MSKEKKLILDKSQILQIVRRMAYQVYEQNHTANQIFLVGIDSNGLKISELIKKELEQISDIPVQLIKVEMDKAARSQPHVNLSTLPDKEHLHIVVVDDVLNSGRTMIYALDPFLQLNIEKLQTAVLVNRSHKRFPIAVDYKGLELATTIEEHIEVQLTEDDYSAFLY
ncbi:pyrimidine operon attenuation protein/uracil phosphoribosyltransferase [Roseivirga pacifica]|uniref:Pyrimidine operon attenuation protein / uracil phosphoribosyltransferase n=1 Tax=Roseivirga pacifica TaxID=1267423 RepID=A0A1I0M7C8_9BACT|nr:phosphoribosyltransferase family protein [Roseivirga pacifica]MCO6358619.1 phosphoribosyltransferase [Roseivirga pacifica]MCO6365745.1 phosphoribosyltransferase [Roseivirga pacifica]MCO6371525.1 phosphoribosyltransferase [Roseivirga pacifica]MCO6376364.1 phosphoribosyltransferase [Roseivirga pacifica]MCO6378903.1 phosphoribosyltransferase [Roseivirga pacifica]